jgi:septal ring factor EnvC (AmiA/AmiB activator)
MRRLSLGVVLLGAAVAAAEPEPSGELHAARRVQAQLERKVDDGDGALRARVRTLYKLEASGDLPFWVDDGAQGRALAARGAARRVILRDLEERRILRAELAAATADVERLRRDEERARFRAAPTPRDGSFLRPVDGDVVASFGTYNDERTHARLVRRGVELHAWTPEVVAAAAGQVRFAGPLRGLGVVVAIDHGQGLVSVVSGLAQTHVVAGELVAAGTSVGRAAGPRVAFEVRRGGQPIDPFPLLGPRR